MGFHPFDQGKKVYGPPRARPARRQVDQIFGRLTDLMRHDADQDVRVHAAYALSHWWERRAALALLAVVGDARGLAAVRAQAAEGLGKLVAHGEGFGAFGLRARAVAALRRGLHDERPEVRFWSIYALGQLQAAEARAEIERLVEDDAMCRNMWRVGEEAQDALAYYDTGTWPERDFSVLRSE